MIDTLQAGAGKDRGAAVLEDVRAALVQQGVVHDQGERPQDLEAGDGEDGDDDAERNRQRLLDAASEVFATRGLDVTLDEMFAIPAVFTLFAWAFAYLYVVVQGVNPGAWGETRSWMELLFLSFTTLSSTGLSDIVPATGHARSVIMLEQLAGIFYIAMVVTRLVALRAYRNKDVA